MSNSEVEIYVDEVWMCAGMECKLRELCDELVGPVHGSVQSGSVQSGLSQWSQSVLVCTQHSCTI